MQIGIKFCGGCNPYIDRGFLVRRLAEELQGCDCSLELSQFTDCDAVVMINGCPVGCSEVPPVERVIRVCGTQLDMATIPEEDLPQALARKIIDLLGL